MRILFGTNKITLVVIMCIVFVSNGLLSQVIPLPCQDETQSAIGLDRKNFTMGSTTILSEGYLHNFDLPTAALNPCKKISQVTVNITINSFTSNPPAGCTVGPYFTNLYTSCPSIAPASCPLANILEEFSNPSPTSTTRNYSCPPENFDFDDVLSVDIVPVSTTGCTDGQTMISAGHVSIDYNICVTVTLVDEMIDIVPDLGLDQTICNPDMTLLDPGNSYTMYSWSPGGETTPTINVGGGTYEVTVTDANGCTDTDDIVITENDPMVNITSNDADNTICSDAMTMLSANTSVTNISWSTFESTPTIMVGPGMYTVTVTDASNCTASDMITIGSIPPPTIIFNPTMPTACGTSTTQVSVTAGYMDYSWSNFLNGNPVDLPTGVYTVTVTDADNCTNSAMVSVDLEIPPNAGNDNAINVCNDNTVYDIQALLGAHDPGGNWTDLNGSGVDINVGSTSTNFLGVTPAVYNFSYTVTGTSPCPDDMAIITVSVNNAPFGGVSTTEFICNPTGTYDFNSLLSNPDIGGFWSELTGSGLAIGNGSMVDLSTLTPDTYIFNYQIPMGGGCQSTSEDLTITIIPPSNAGTGSTISLCEGSTFNLTSLLTADADLTGTFIEIGGGSTLTGSMISTSGQAGSTLVYEYQVGSVMDPCGLDIATFNVNVVSSVSAGDDVTEDDCLTGTIDLNTYIVNGDLGGTFQETSSSGALTGSTFNIDMAGTGVYTFTYTVGDGVTCPTDVAQIQIEIFEVPTISLNTTNSLCTNQCEDLTISLTGVPSFTYALDVYDQSGILTDINLQTTSSTTSTFTICNDGGSGTFANDTLHLNELASPFGLFVSSFSDDNCDLDLSQSMDTLFVDANAASINSFDTIICMSDTLVVDGDAYFFGNSTRQDTLAGISCDSIISINISFYQEDSLFFEPTLCAGDSLEVNGVFYNSLNPIDTIVLTNVNGCDSTLFVNLSFYPISETLIDNSLCTGQFITVNGTVYDELNSMGVEVLMGMSSNGCDSTVTINLGFGADATILRDDILCPDESITVNGNIYDMSNPSGTESLMGTTCDTTVTIDLSFYTNLDSLITGTFCPDFFVMVNGTRYDMANPSGMEVIPNGSVFGCDSIVDLNLNFFLDASSDRNDILCQNESVIINGTTYDFNNQSGIETLPGMSANGCDSTINVNLNFNLVSIANVSAQICEGDSIFLENAWQLTAGNYIDTFPSINNCDSIIMTDLSIQMCTDQVIVMEGDNICGAGMDGVISIDLNDGLLPISIEWVALSTGVSNSTSASTLGNIMITDLPSDSYQLVIMDAMGVVIYTGTSLIEDLNPEFSINIDIVNDLLCEDDLATLEAVATGGSPNFSYSWNDPTIGDNAIADNLMAGNYSVTATDINNCIDSSTVILITPSAINYDLTLIDPSCTDPMSGSIIVENITGGTSPYMLFINGSIVSGDSLNDIGEGSYLIEVMDDNSCSSIVDTTLSSPSVNSFLNYIDSYTILQGDSIELEILSNSNGVLFVWEDDPALSCTDCSSPIARPITTQTFSGVAINEDGCEESFTILVNVEVPEVEIYVPNAFSPNNDSVNDELQIFTSLGDNIIAINIKIYDRWGNQVHAFAGAATDYSWDGRFKNEPLMNGVYVYTLELADINGGVYTQQGDITLIR